MGQCSPLLLKWGARVPPAPPLLRHPWKKRFQRISIWKRFYFSVQKNVNWNLLPNTSQSRFVLNRRDRYASVTNMMSLLGWPTLKSRRTNAKLIMLYKIINNIVDVDLDGNLLMSASSYHTRCHLTQPYSRVDAYKYSFIPSAIKLWNTLPHDVVYQETVNNFQNKLLTNIINL